MRDRLVWQLLSTTFAAPSPASILEVGGTNRLGDRIRLAYDYINADVVGRNTGVDMLFDRGRLALPDGSRTFVIMSHVLSYVPERRHRIRLLTELRRIVADGGRLLMMDDLDFTMQAHRRLRARDYFHMVRFGRALFAELIQAGWLYQVVTHCAIAEELGAERELPFVSAIAGGSVHRR